MAETRLQCPSCKAVLKTTAALPAGKSVKCPKCQGAIRVPGAAPAKPPQPTERPKPPPPPKEDDPDNEDIAREEVEDEEDEDRPAPKKPAPARRPPRDESEDEDEARDDEEPEDEEEDDRPRKKKAKKDKKSPKATDGKRQMWLWLGIGGGAAAAVTVVLIIVLGGKKDGEDGKNGKPGSNGDGSANISERTIDTQIPQAGYPFLFCSADASVVGLVFSGQGDKTVFYTVDGNTGHKLAEIPCSKKTLGETFQAGLISPDGKFAIVDFKDELQLRDTRSGNIVKTLRIDEKNVHSHVSVSFSPNSAILAACARGTDKFIVGWDTATGQQLFKCKVDRGNDYPDIAFHPDGKTVLALPTIRQESQSITVWDIARQTVTKRITLPYKGSKCIASPDGNHVAIISGRAVGLEGDTVVDIWSLETGQKVAALEDAPKTRSTYAGFLPDGSLLLAVQPNWANSRVPRPKPFLATYDPLTGKKKRSSEYDGDQGHLLSHKGDVLGVEKGEKGSPIKIRIVRLKD